MILAILIVLGFKGCLDSRKDNALKDYNRNVTAVINDSDQSVGKPFFQRMSDGARNSSQLQVQVNQLRLAAEDDVKRAKAFDVPGDMGAAQRNLELVLNLRAEGLTKIADQIPGRARPRADLRDGDQQHRRRDAGLPRPPTSSTPSAWRRSSRTPSTRTASRASRSPASRFMTDVSWLAPATVASHLGRSASSGSSGTSGQAAPGLHGHGL